MRRLQQALTNATCLDLRGVASPEQVMESSFEKSRQLPESNMLPSGRSYTFLWAVCILGLAAVCCLLHFEYKALAVRQSQLEHQLASLVKITDKMLQDRGLHRDLQLEFDEIFRVARDQESRNSPGKSEDSIEDVVGVRRKRDVLENEKSGNLPRGQKRRRKKPGKPRKHKGTKKALLQRPSDPAINCSCRTSDIIDEYLKSHPPGVLHVPKVTTFPSIHLVGPDGGIQVKFRQYLTWKHSHELTLTVNNVSENLDLCHQNHMKQEAHEFIVIPQNGMYYVYCQVMYSDGRSPNVGHTTVLKRKGSETVTVLMRSGSTEVDSQSNVCIKRDDGKTRSLSPSDSAYHGGVFHLLEGDRLGVMASAPGECFASSPEQTYFGAFMVSPSVNINIAQTEDASVDDDFFGQALDLLLSPARAFWNLWKSKTLVGNLKTVAKMWRIFAEKGTPVRMEE